MRQIIYGEEKQTFSAALQVLKKKKKSTAISITLKWQMFSQYWISLHFLLLLRPKMFEFAAAFVKTCDSTLIDFFSILRKTT